MKMIPLIAAGVAVADVVTTSPAVPQREAQRCRRT